MAAEPVAALHVLGRPGEQQLAEAKSRDEHLGFADLAGLELDPLDRIAGVIDLHAFAGLELARRDGRLAVLRELAIKLFPEVRVGDEVLRPLLPEELQREAEPEIVDDRRPIELRHPQRIGLAAVSCVRRSPSRTSRTVRREQPRARAISRRLRFLASDDSSYVNGVELFVDGGIAQI